ncbi:MAG: YigZ family protein [Clostridiales bacterium]|nr:YigZ family protein [Clostridiales bacterium]
MKSINENGSLLNEKYITVRRTARATFEERRSIFIGHAGPFTDPDGAMDFVKKIKAEYSDATHNVYAYYLRGGAVARYSDDGEPQGTAGIPVLDVIKKSGCDDVCVVVTRYFGGTLLGAGGLVRAYTEAAKRALEAAEIVTYGSHTVFKIIATYADYQKILHELNKINGIVDRTDFNESVELVAAVKQELQQAFIDVIGDITAGRVNAEIIGSRFDCI